MRKISFLFLTKFILILTCGLLCTSTKAQDTFSPQLIHFAESHPQGSNILMTEIIKTEHSSGNIQIFYFYTYDESVTTAHHNMFENGSGAAIFIRGGRPVVDEYLDILFEVLNMSGDKRFKELYQQAKMASISQTNFVTEIL